MTAGRESCAAADGGGAGGGVGWAGDAPDLAVDDFLRLVGLMGVGVGGDGDVAQEVRFVGGVENKLDALDGDVGGDVELREGGWCLAE